MLINSLVVWETWEDYKNPNDLFKTWPIIVGKIRKNELALVLQISEQQKGSKGAKIFTESKLIGWVSLNALEKIFW